MRFGSHEFRQIFADEFVGLITERVSRRFVDRFDYAVQAVNIDKSRTEFKQFTIASLAFIQFLFGDCPRRDVNGNAADKFAAVRAENREFQTQPMGRRIGLRSSRKPTATDVRSATLA